MHILARGSLDRIKALISKLGSSHDYVVFTERDDRLFEDADIIFDLSFDDDPLDICLYEEVNVPLVLSAVKASLSEILDISRAKDPIFGLNAFSGFIDSQVWEMTTLKANNKKVLIDLFPELDIEWVSSRVGMVTPRVISMIINEACYTLQEGTANIKDIDKGMKLGTNYPKGPFEWADEIGVGHIYDTLEALYLDTGDVRFKICPLLKEYALLNQSFYSTHAADL
tara:strand:+ start:76 stop:753 length:678 start_codon:yes stop_codon:yes gene_type:complete